MLNTKLAKIIIIFVVVLLIIIIGSKLIFYLRDKGRASNTLEEIEYRKNLAYKFIQDKMTLPSGGIYTNFITNKTYEFGIQGNDILLENVALMMAYAIIEQNLSLFEKQFKYLTEYMITDTGFIPWYVQVDGNLKIYSTSTLDDIRIVKQLIKAFELWGMKEHIITAADIIGNIYKYDTNNFHLTNYYNWDEKRKSNRIELSYIDISALELFSKVNSNFTAIKNNGEKIIKRGTCRDFPFYRQAYNYSSKDYEQNDEVNIINLLLTTLNDAKFSDNQRNVLKWIKSELENNNMIFGKYNYYSAYQTVDYESIPGYAMALRLALQENDLELVDRLINKLLSFQDLDITSPTYGGFVFKSGGGSYSFDNLQAIISLSLYVKRVKGND